MKKTIIAAGILLILLFYGCEEIADEKATTSTLPKPKVSEDARFDFSEGECQQASDCTYAGEGCGGDHGVCTNNPDKYKGMMTTCDIVENHPVNNGYTCACAQNKCGWLKGEAK